MPKKNWGAKRPNYPGPATGSCTRGCSRPSPSWSGRWGCSSSPRTCWWPGRALVLGSGSLLLLIGLCRFCAVQRHQFPLVTGCQATARPLMASQCLGATAECVLDGGTVPRRRFPIVTGAWLLVRPLHQHCDILSLVSYFLLSFLFQSTFVPEHLFQ